MATLGDQGAALTKQYCLMCHNDGVKSGSVSLQGVDFSKVGEHGELFERVLRKVRLKEMPPAGMPRPAQEVVDKFTSSLEAALDAEMIARPNPGRAAAHRLNRAEYSNVIRDLLAVDIEPGAWLPVDDSGYGFDNIADVLSMSPALMERYMSAARRVTRLAVGDMSQKPGEEVFMLKRDPNAPGRRNDRISDDLPFDSRGGMVVKYYFPVDAEYEIRATLTGVGPGGDAPDDGGPKYNVRMPIKAGLHTVGVTWLRENVKAENEGSTGRQGGGGAAAGRAGGPAPDPFQLDFRLDGARLKVYEVKRGSANLGEVDSVIVSGPFNPTARGNTPSRAKIFVCQPATPREEPACAKTILSNLARRAFRRPVTDADVTPLLAFYTDGRKKGADFDEGIRLALDAMLVSPDFLFRIERDPKTTPAKPGNVYKISDLELASRLSFFLWSSTPDDELLGLAERGRLRQPAVLQAQVKRMLSDARAEALVNNFAGQWLYVRNVAQMTPDPELFQFDDNLRDSMQKETMLLFTSILREDRSLLDLLAADYTYLNQRLADHYGIKGVYGSQFRRVQLTDPNRRGLLGQGSVLLVTSYPNRTSVVQRGKWVLENLLGTPPPPPPPDVPPLPARETGQKLTMRQQMEQHRANPICSSCHSQMDPIGFALENYDAVGRWREEDGGAAIDASGKLSDGTPFSGPAGLTELMLTRFKDQFVMTASDKLLTYALGRGTEYYDQPTVRAIARETAKNGYKVSSWVTAVINSTPFQMRRAAQP